MQSLNYFKGKFSAFVLVFVLATLSMLNTITLNAEDIDVDSLLLEMDSLAAEVDSMTPESLLKPVVQTSQNEPAQKVIPIEAKTAGVSKPNNVEVNKIKPSVVSKVVKEKPEAGDKDKEKLIKITEQTEKKNPNSEGEKKKVAQEKKPKDIDEEFGDFKVSKVVIDENGKKTKRRIMSGRDPFAPSVAMVSDYQKKVDDKKKKLEEIRLAKQKEIDLKNDIEKKKKEAAEMLAKQAAAMKAKVVQTRALALPKMKLKGFIRKPGQGVLALLDIKGLGTHIVRKGDTVSLGAKGTLRILEINNMSVTVKSGKVADKVVVR